MVEKKDQGKQKIRVFLAVALIKVNNLSTLLLIIFQICKKFPIEFFNLEFPKII